MKYLTPKDIGKIFEKSAKDINAVFSEIEFIEKNQNGGWNVTQKGIENGGIQKNILETTMYAGKRAFLKTDYF